MGEYSEFAVFCGFDEVAVDFDLTRAILRAFAMEGWREMERIRRAGGVGAREYLSGQARLIRAERRHLDAFLQTVCLVPGFRDFILFCRKAGLDLTIVSEGLDYAVLKALAGQSLYGLPVMANRLVFQGEDRYAVSFPHSAVDCGQGVCKCNAAMEKNLPILLIGGAASEICLAGFSSFILALENSPLRRYCMKNRFQHKTFRNMAELRAILAALLPRRGWSGKIYPFRPRIPEEV